MYDCKKTLSISTFIRICMYVCTVQLFIGRAPEQVDEFLAECVDPILAKNAEKVGKVAVDGVDV